jgi:AbrB family looped-hinge helix DNA binding protein
MKRYQVTRKLQVTIPKKFAESLDIRPGDCVFFEESEGELRVKKAPGERADPQELRNAVEGFAMDMKRIGPHVRDAESALIENLSRHVNPE